jgi:hypothetical protein
MVNIGFNLASLLGFFDCILAICFFLGSIAVLKMPSGLISSIGIRLYIVQALILPLFLLVAGIILIFQGWRLDPLLIFALTLLNGSIIFLGLKDLILLRLFDRP